ncbi:hypothetical protein SNOG_05406 [Parastagonospora nodorum SN15]|uniref:Uncharacterized protein n=1 Tax=Phaeosphaeria nodorum (strain SN15 / ATCC MYA-4574 / FGSC 10173) TaxID=321614 RepID=Q0US58_PHANO|nr:hypothetical protein SNOG_05406 [Parastagonospora nodorum SN15]EAT87797.1 hypothetical protein SNOG_05406 [Parastagonospora nodorum SN15]
MFDATDIVISGKSLVFCVDRSHFFEGLSISGEC